MTEADELVVVSLNTHSFQEEQDPLDKLQWIGAGLASLDADLVGLNEVLSGTFHSYDYDGAEYDGAELIREALEEASGEAWHALAVGFAHWDTGELMSNVVLSRYTLLESDSRSLTTTDFWPAPKEQRNAVYARVEVPDLGPVNLFVTHTWGWDSADTEAQIAEVKQFMVDKYRGDEALDLLVGDLNVPAGSQAYQLWTGPDPFRLMDTYGMANPEGFYDSTQLDGEDRIDYVLAGEGWELSEDASNYVSQLVFDGTTLPVVSDHKGVVTRFVLP